MAETSPAAPESNQSSLFLVDTSALARWHQEPVRHVLTALLHDHLAATCVTVDLEATYSARTSSEVEQVADSRRQLYVVLPITEAIAERAREVQVLMAGAGLHRAAGAFDLITAAVAEHHGATLLHYDGDFEHIASVTGQPHRWIAPRGSLDQPPRS